MNPTGQKGWSNPNFVEESGHISADLVTYQASVSSNKEKSPAEDEFTAGEASPNSLDHKVAEKKKIWDGPFVKTKDPYRGYRIGKQAVLVTIWVCMVSN